MFQLKGLAVQLFCYMRVCMSMDIDPPAADGVDVGIVFVIK